MSTTSNSQDDDELIKRVDATVRWLIAYRALATDARRCGLGTESTRRPESIGPQRKADR